MKRRRFSFLALLMLAVILLMPASTQAAAKPGTVKLTGIKAMDYNKINIKWRKTSGATNYIVYYKKAGASKWTKMKTLDNTKSSYVHTSSKKYPIITGQKYQYTVKAYNSQTKKSGNYNKTGLTARTIPQTAKLVSAKVKNGTVDITWKKSGGADKYFLLYKVQTDEFTTNWTKLATLNADTTSYTVKYPFKNATNIYTVRSYNSASNVYGKYDDKGISVFVTAGNTGGNNNDKDDVGDDITPTPAPVNAEAMASEVIRLTNIERAKAGRSALIYNSGLQKAAMIRAKEISVKFSHTRPNGTDSSTVGKDVGAAGISGENIAMGYDSPEDVVEGWMNSSGHKATMMMNNFCYMGVGFYKSDNGMYYWTQEFASMNPNSNGLVIIDANGGTINGNSTYTITGTAGYYAWLSNAPQAEEIVNIPTPTRSGYTFSGWYDTKTPASNRKPLKAAVYTTSGMTVYAKWIPNN